MIKKVDIHNFGTFKNFQWNDHLGEDFFGGRNIIYGRNYSGKTTLSRIFRCLEKGSNHKDFDDSEYCVTLDNEEQVSNRDLSSAPYKIRVYNSDFVKENLEFLYHEDGDILPFTILGKENIDAQRKIDQENKYLMEIRKKLGEIDNDGVKQKVNETNNNLKSLEKEITKKLREKASEIRNNPLLFIAGKKKKYDIRDLESEIPTSTSIDETKKEDLESILKEEIKESIVDIPNLDLDYTEILEKANEVLSIEVRPSKVIQELSNNSELQEWVKEGIKLHKEQRQTCAFCGNNIEETRWDELDKHFTKRVENFTTKLEALMQEVKNREDYVKNFNLPIKSESFYSVFQEDFHTINNRLEEIKNISASNLLKIYEKLKERRNDIFSSADVIEIRDDVSSEIHSIYKELSRLIDNNDNYTQEFSEKQEKVRELLRSNDVYNFKKVYDYDEKISEIKKVRERFEELEKQKEELEHEETNTLRRINTLEDSLKDEEESIVQVNYYLRTYLGHNELYLAIEDKKNEGDKLTRFTIMRNNTEAKNLSEGEQSLIAFCYFLATLKDIENVEEYTVFIDDPISSLDSNHIFYIFSLLNSEIASKKFKQVFISTHNLDFLKYLRRLSKPTGNDIYKNKYYLIEKNINISEEETKAILKSMPDYLKSYSTEFIYLFHQIYIVAKEREADENYQSFYNFPNIARKFLETYMFFKFPDSNMKNDKRLKNFFDDDIKIEEFLNRINNEFSHGESQPDRLFKPIDIPEFKKDANIILSAIWKNDEKQYYAFLSSINELPEKEENE